jgi:hypothetical protein
MALDGPKLYLLIGVRKSLVKLGAVAGLCAGGMAGYQYFGTECRDSAPETGVGRSP